METQRGEGFRASTREHLLTSAHGAVAEGAVGEALRVVRWCVLILMVAP